ncbi:DNA recombination protein RmuC homolog [Candidatus Methylobacter favarea]|uniref:DNA recombination protein RmuC homolog n=1 Tax=Candidatus Methylobacter favarea TaxID=2707345 RepID=A0A8S0YAL9_9GAMM|nr:DNA recombination protein RmuC [Candidatus Methylobacter favarea]CAA9892187.1 DNA recombination protein RmuC homolog [Candidatus Methylobacter favarea]
MELINHLSPLIPALIGFLAGVLLMRLLGGKDKTAIQQLSTQIAVAEEKLKQCRQNDIELRQLQQLVTEFKTQNVELQTRMDEQAKNAAEKLKLLQDSEARLTIQFENLAGKIFDERSKQFTEHNKTSLDHIVTPLREQLGEFKQRIETVYDNENKDRISLREEIVSLRRDTAQMNQEALNLTRALKGDKKTQGNWGEMILEKVLEKSGLRKGIEYETQGAFRDEDNRLFKPDIIIRLPENKDVIIDSKVSLLAYERYCSSEDDLERITALRQHTDAVREHIKSLSGKDYFGLKGLRSLDFVLLFIPIEAAFIAAFQADEHLFSDAFEYKIVVVTPTTLLATLRTVENIWRYERRNENARAIADKAGVVYDKIRGFVDELDKLGKQLSTVNNTYDGVMNKLTGGHGNLIRHASSFVDLGVKVKKTFPKSITEQAGIETEESSDEKLF